MGTEQSHDDPGPEFQVLLSKPCFEVQHSGQWRQVGIRGLDSWGETDFPVPALLCAEKSTKCLHLFSQSIFTATL